MITTILTLTLSRIIDYSLLAGAALALLLLLITVSLVALAIIHAHKYGDPLDWEDDDFI